MKYNPRENRLIGEVHHKYLMQEKPTGSYYVDIFRKPTADCLSTILSIKQASTKYAGVEKTGVHAVCMNEADVLDVEIAFTRCHPPIHGRTGELDRLDYLKLEMQNGKPMLVFYEAKTIANSEIKAKDRPHVLDQMDGYTKTLTGHANEIVRSYNMVCDNIRELRIRRKGNLIGMVQNNLTVDNIDDLPRLIIFGYDKSKESSSWGGHYEKLKKELGDRVILRER